MAPVRGRDASEFRRWSDLGFALRQAAVAIGASPDNASQHAVEAPSPAAIREHLAKVLSSPLIAGAERLSALLRFIVEETLNGRQAQRKEMRIGLDGFGSRATLGTATPLFTLAVPEDAMGGGPLQYDVSADGRFLAAIGRRLPSRSTRPPA